MPDEECECRIPVKLEFEARGETICQKCGFVFPDRNYRGNQHPEPGSPMGSYGPAIKSEEEIRPGDIEAFLPIKKKMEKSAERGNYENIDNLGDTESNESWELINRIKIEMYKFDFINQRKINRDEKKLTFFEHLNEIGQSELLYEYRKCF